MADYKFDTIQLHAGQERPDPATDARAVPIYATTSYVFHDCADAAARFGLQAEGNIYGRLTNSTQEVFEKRIAALEGGSAALAVASGAAAITYTLQALAQNGGHIVSQKTIYGGSYNLLAHTLPNLGITASFVDIHDLEAVERAITEQTKALYIETLGNPNCDIPDMDALAELAHKYQIPLVVDNTFGTPYWIRPIEHGADIVVHSATKFIGGHGTTLGGVIVDSGRFDWKASGKYPAITDPNDSYHGVVFSQAAPGAAFVTYIRAVILRDMGAAISPFAAFLLLQGTETLSLRLERHAENTKKVIEYLNHHPLVEKVNHPLLADHPDHDLYCDIPDMDALAELAHKYQIPLVVDNTFGTPYWIRPIEHGADIVVHSATKFIGGHGTTLGGVIVDSGRFDWKASGKYPAITDPNDSYHGVVFSQAAPGAAFVTYIRAVILRDMGAAISPFAAFLLLQGTETLSLRLERHAENTKKVIEYLNHHPLVEKVNHPLLADHPDHDLYKKFFKNGGGSIFTFEIKGGIKEAHEFIDHLEIFSLLANVADVKSLVIHPATTTHSQLNAQELQEQGIRQNTIRLSIGTEHIDDIIADLEKGFASVEKL